MESQIKKRVVTRPDRRREIKKERETGVRGMGGGKRERKERHGDRKRERARNYNLFKLYSAH